MSYSRGDVPVSRKLGTQGNKILARTPFKAVPMTIDFTNVSADADGNYKVPAGTPVDSAGAPMTAFKVNTGSEQAPSYKYAEGVLLYDVYKDEPAGAVLVDAFIDCTAAKAATSLAYNAAFIANAFEANTKTGHTLKFENVVAG